MTVLGVFSAVLGALGTAALGYIIAMWTVKGERSFDRRLVWYEEMVQILLDFSYNLHVAATVTREGCPDDVLENCWNGVQGSERNFDTHVAKGVIYADSTTLESLRNSLSRVQEESGERGGFNWVIAKHRALEPIHGLADSLRVAAEPIAMAARQQLYGLRFFAARSIPRPRE